MNLFEFNTFRVLVDYAHNPDGYRGIEEYLSDTTATRKIGIISGVGDRRDSDIVECAAISARMFDHIIIRNESDLRGRTEEDINNLLLRGVREVSNNVSCDIVQDEFDAMRYALSIAAEGDFIIALTDQIDGVVAIINEALESEKQHNTQLIRSA
jgi:cyanophycin synthetase